MTLMALAATYGVCVCGRVPFKLTCAHVFDVTANWIVAEEAVLQDNSNYHPSMCIALSGFAFIQSVVVSIAACKFTADVPCATRAATLWLIRRGMPGKWPASLVGVKLAAQCLRHKLDTKNN